MKLLSLKRFSGEGLEGGSSTGDPGIYVKKAPNMGMYHHRGPFKAEGYLESGRGLVYRGL